MERKLIPRSLFIAAKEKEKKRQEKLTLENEAKFITVLAYYRGILKQEDEDFAKFTVIYRSGEETVFDQLLLLNHEWGLFRKWRKNGKDWESYHKLSAHDTTTSKVLTMDLSYKVGDTYISGGYGYAGEKFYIRVRRTHLDIFVYKGREPEMLHFWGKTITRKYNLEKEKNIHLQIDALLTAQTPIGPDEIDI